MSGFRTPPYPGLDHPDYEIRKAFGGYICIVVALRRAEALMRKLPTQEQRDAEAKRLKPYYGYRDGYSAIIIGTEAKTHDGAMAKARHFLTERERRQPALPETRGLSASSIRREAA